MELARHLSRISPSRSIETEQNQEPGYTAARAREIIADAVRAPFGDLAPAVVVDDSIVANAIAGPRRIRLNANAPFSRRYIDQLIQHEALVHVATFLNGRAQTCLPLLARGHPGITQTQEGLAVFAELMSGTKDSLRFRRLADRAIAIDMAIQGADFIQVWRYFRTKGIRRLLPSTTHNGFSAEVCFPGAQDIDRLNCHFSYTNFINGVAMDAVRNHHIELLRCVDC